MRTREKAAMAPHPVPTGGQAQPVGRAQTHPHAAGTPNWLLTMQRAVGNAAVARTLEQRRQSHHEPRNGAAARRSVLHDVLRSPGRPLDDSLRQEMQARLGADLNDVRVHTGGAAQRSAAELNARAYTAGHHVVLGHGGADKCTLAHELTHVIQQRRGAVSGRDRGDGLAVSHPDDPFERHAEQTAARALSGPAPDNADIEPPPVAAAGPGTVVQRRVAFELETRDIRVKRSPFAQAVTDKRDVVLSGAGWRLEADDTVGDDRPDSRDRLAPGLNGEFILGGAEGKGFDTDGAGLTALSAALADLISQTNEKIPAGGRYSIISNDAVLDRCDGPENFWATYEKLNETDAEGYWRVHRTNPNPTFAIQMTAGVRPTTLADMFRGPARYEAVISDTAWDRFNPVTAEDVRRVAGPHLPAGTDLDRLAGDPALLATLSMLKSYTHQVAEGMQNIKEAIPLLGKTNFVGMLGLVDAENQRLLGNSPANIVTPAEPGPNVTGWRRREALRERASKIKRTERNLWFLLCHDLVRSEAMITFPHKYPFSWEEWVTNLLPPSGTPRDMLQEADMRYDKSFGALGTRVEPVSGDGTMGPIVEFRKPGKQSGSLGDIKEIVEGLAAALALVNRPEG
jgi:hypothetical protein